MKESHALTEVVLIAFQVFVRAFDLDERLVGVAFMDVGVYVTALRCLKNLLLVSDAVRSVWFVAFQVRCGNYFWRPLHSLNHMFYQEDPFKLIVLSKDMAPLRLFSAEFFFAENELLFLSADLEGVVRLHSYDPSRAVVPCFLTTTEVLIVLNRSGDRGWDSIADLVRVPLSHTATKHHNDCSKA